MIDEKVSDDQVHTLTVVRDGRQLSFTLDGNQHQNKTSIASFQVFNTEGNIFIGGGGPQQVSALTEGKAVRTFVGCIHSISINNSPIDFRDNVQSSNLVPCTQ